jgi:signal transduction histidine kinase
MQITDPQRFTLVSIIIVASVMIATGIAAPTFLRRAMTERETAVMQDMITITTHEEEAEGYLSASYLANFTESDARAHLEISFRSLTRLPGFFKIKVFGADRKIVWSDDAELVGTAQTHHPEAVSRALLENLPSAFNPALSVPNVDSLIEFYLPFKLAAVNGPVSGVVSLYRSAGPIDAAVKRGVFLLWALFGVNGLVMYGALYSLFLAVYRSRREISSQFATLSGAHERLMQTEKLSAMGQMVSEIAHQLNNPLVGVINLAELAEREIDNPARVKELLGQVRSAGEDCREYVQRVLQLSQLTRSERQPTDIKRLALDTVAFFQQSLGRHLSVTVGAPAEPLISDVDENLLRNALFNLIHNASQADPNGTILLSVAREERDGRPGVSIAVSDRGPGFPPEAADKLFEPFFTTRSGGTGLGLSIAQHIAILHDGAISAENRPEGGASFTIWIPTAEATR